MNWIQKSKDNLCSLFPKGGVPNSFIKKCGLKREHLDDIDVAHCEFLANVISQETPTKK